MEKCIGGYFELESLINNPYHKGAIELNSARNALLYIVRSRNIKKIYTPYYMCDSINFIEKYCERKYYEIGTNFLPIFNKSLKSDEYLYIVNYFGTISNETILKLKEKYKNIIIDNVQAFFQNNVEKVDTIYSCRKFFGVTDGAYLYTDKRMEKDEEESLDTDESNRRYNYVLGRLEKTPQDFFADYRKNEELLNNLPLMKMSKATKMILGAFDYNKIKEKRSKNFKFLNDNLKCINKLKLENIEGAYSYPLYIKDGENLRKFMIDKNIFTPTLWPNVIEENKSTQACDFAKNIVVIPSDQRYGLEEMKRIINIIKESCYE